MKYIMSALLALRAMPFVNTQLFIHASARGSKRRRAFLLCVSIAGFICNALTLLGADRLCFASTHSPLDLRAIFHQYRGFLTLRCSCQDIRALVASSVICMILSFVYGFAARLAFKAQRGPAALYRAEALSALLVVLWLPFMILGSHIAWHGEDHIKLSEFCRRTADGLPAHEGAPSDSSGQSEGADSYVCLYNDGPLTCTFEAFLLTADSSGRGVSLGRITVPPHETRACALRYGHDLRLNSPGETSVILASSAGRQLDSVAVPPLEKGEAYRRDEGSGVWHVCRYVRKNNGKSDWAPIVPTPVFSMESGFYDAPFQLTLHAEAGYQIHYTLDGSVPSRKSPDYTGPITVRDASLNENTYSMRTNVSTGFYDEDIRQLTTSTPPGYKAPDFLIDKCTVVRAVCFDEQGNRSEVVSHSYFVDFSRKAGYDGMNVISIIMKPGDLFNDEKGIYVTGEDFDEYISSLKAGKSVRKAAYWWWWDANYRRKGRESEKSAWMEWFDSDGSLELSKKIGVRVQGGGSRGYVPRSLNLYARDAYDGSAAFNISLDSSGFTPQRMTLFAGGDAYITKLEDYLMSRFVSDRHIATMTYLPCVLFLNGEYWGNYWMTDKFDEEYLAYHYKVDRSDVVMIKNKKVAEGEPEDLALYEEMTAFIKDSDMTVQENYDSACEMIDITSFIDYYAVQAYISRFSDWPRSNFALWRTRSSDGGHCSDGRWRWMLFDDNSGAFSPAHTTEDTLQRLKEEDALFGSLTRNKSFERRFVETLRALAVDCFTPERVRAFFSDYIAAMSEPFRKEYARFYGSDNAVYEDTFLPRVKQIESFLLDRHDFILEYCDDYLSRTSQPTDDAEGGD